MERICLDHWSRVNGNSHDVSPHLGLECLLAEYKIQAATSLVVSSPSLSSLNDILDFYDLRRLPPRSLEAFWIIRLSFFLIIKLGFSPPTKCRHSRLTQTRITEFPRSLLLLQQWTVQWSQTQNQTSLLKTPIFATTTRPIQIPLPTPTSLRPADSPSQQFFIRYPISEKPHTNPLLRLQPV